MKKLLILTLFILAACSTKETPPTAECLQAQKVYNSLCERQAFFYDKYNYAIELNNAELIERYGDSIVAVRSRKNVYAYQADSAGCTLVICD